MTILRTVGTLAIVCMLGACATTGGATAGAGAVGADPAVASASSSLGLKETLIQAAITAARNYLTKGKDAAATATQDAAAAATQKEEAAKVGVQAAVDKAKADNQPALTDVQQSGLLSVLKNIL